jgi:hypothetical protein
MKNPSSITARTMRKVRESSAGMMMATQLV